MKKYRLKKWYPSLGGDFEVKDIAYFDRIRGCYVSAHDRDISLRRREVENNPDFWELIEEKANNMEKEVKFEDREHHIEYIKMALNICEIDVSYQQAELIGMLVRECDRLRGDFTVEDACAIFSAHKKKWDKYFNEEKN